MRPTPFSSIRRVETCFACLLHKSSCTHQHLRRLHSAALPTRQKTSRPLSSPVSSQIALEEVLEAAADTTDVTSYGVIRQATKIKTRYARSGRGKLLPTNKVLSQHLPLLVLICTRTPHSERSGQDELVSGTPAFFLYALPSFFNIFHGND